MSDLLSQCSDSSYLSDLDDIAQSINLILDKGSPLNDDDFLCLHFNINSIRADGRLDELTRLCTGLKCVVLILSETKIDNTIPNNILKISGFHEPLRRDRNISGGGTIIYIAEHLTFKYQTTLQNDMFEHLWVDVKVKGLIYAINALYRPSTQTSVSDYQTFLTAADEVLTKLSNHTADNYLFMSDMNFGNLYCKSPILTPKPLDETAPELFQSYGYNQLIDIPTRVTDVCT